MHRRAPFLRRPRFKKSFKDLVEFKATAEDDDNDDDAAPASEPAASGFSREPITSSDYGKIAPSV